MSSQLPSTSRLLLLLGMVVALIACQQPSPRGWHLKEYQGKFLLAGSHSHIVYDYWQKIYSIQKDPQTLFSHFYQLWSTLEDNGVSPTTQRALRHNFNHFCQAHGLQQQWQAFWKAKTASPYNYLRRGFQ